MNDQEVNSSTNDPQIESKKNNDNKDSEKEVVGGTGLDKTVSEVTKGTESIFSMWFSITRKYVLHHHTFRPEQLPIQISTDENSHYNITQDFVTIDAGRKAPVLTVTAIKRNELKAKRFTPFEEKKAKGEFVDREDSNTLIKATLGDVLPELERMAQQVFYLIRWRFRLSGYNNEIVEESFRWSSDSSTWSNITGCAPPTGVSVTYLPEVKLSKVQIETLIGGHLKDNINEPIHHSLLREAKSIVSSSPTSAFVISVVSLETAVKYFISRMVPSATWLVDNSPSPDVHRLLKEFIPNLKPDFILPTADLDEVKSIIGNRNKMVHSGKMDFDINRIVRSLILIENIISTIDHHAGWPWIQDEDISLG